MRHYLLTRSAYGPQVPLDVNRRRLELLRAITARSLRSARDVTWLVLVDPADALLDERTEVLRSAGLELVIGDAGKMVRDHRYDRPWGPWAHGIQWGEPTLTTRIDDDDAFAPWALERVRSEADALTDRRRVLLVLPTGWRLNGPCANVRRDPVSQFTSLWAPRNDRTTVMDMNHTSAARLARRVIQLDTPPAWLWLRHPDARSRESGATRQHLDAMEPIGDELRRSFDIDWEWYEARYRQRPA